MAFDWQAHGVLADFRRCQTTSENTDLVFHCINGNVTAHQVIFAGISSLFKNLMHRFLVGQELFPQDMNISLPDIRREHMGMVMDIVYTGKVSLTKSDYEPFREICQLLELCVPISDYDEFFTRKQGEESKEAQISQVKVSIPLKSWPDSPVFVCDACDATFSSKIDLKRHKKTRHVEIDLEVPNSPDHPEPCEVLNPKQSVRGKRPVKRPWSSTDKNFAIDSQNGKPTLKCPDCLSYFRPQRVRQHVTTHLRDHLNKFVTENKSVPGRMKCKTCDFEARAPSYVRCHAGIIHNLVEAFASASQKKFMEDARGMMNKRSRL